MQRRDVLRILATGAAAQLAPSKLLALTREMRALLASQPTPRTLNRHQEATVTKLAELMLPRTDTPGAIDVGVTQFIDLILTDWYDDSERSRFLNGLADVDSRAKALFEKDFIDCTAPQQSAILIALGEQMADEAVRERRHPFAEESPTDPNFYTMFRRLALTAYYTSEAGATEELHFEIVPGRYQGCATAPTDKKSTEQ